MPASFLLLSAVIGAGVYAIGAFVTFTALRRAPDGYEDETGFHAVDREAGQAEEAQPLAGTTLDCPAV